MGVHVYGDMNVMDGLFRIIVTDLFAVFVSKQTYFEDVTSPWMMDTLRCMWDFRDKACERVGRTKAA